MPGKDSGIHKNYVFEKPKELPGIFQSQAELYVFPDVSYYFGKSDGDNRIETAEDLCMYILNNAWVSLVTGEAFGAPDCIRISYAASDEKLLEAFGRIKELLSKLK